VEKVERFKAGDYVYDEKHSSIGKSTYDVAKITYINKNAVYGYWAMDLNRLPISIEEFNSLHFDRSECNGDMDVLQIIKFERGEAGDEVLIIDECSMVGGYGDLVELKAEIVSNIMNLDNYDSKILMGLANLSQEEVMDYFMNIVMPKVASIVQSSNL